MRRWAALPRPVWVVQAGTAVSRCVRADAGNSVNVFRLGAAADEPAVARRCAVERWDHSAAAQRFERVSVQALRGDHAG